MKVILTVIDVTGTQNYIFGSNRLRESIGASELIAQATDNWVKGILKISDTTTKIEDGNTDAEIVYVGGGNAVILFKTDEQNEKKKAIDFTREYTKKLLIDTPNLDVVVAHSSAFEFDNNRDILEVHKEVMKQISIKKNCRPLSAQLKGLAVSAQCVSTGETASFSPKELLGFSDERFETLEEKYGDNYVSAEVFEKLKMVDVANDRLKNDLFSKVTSLPETVTDKFSKDKFFPPLGFDNLGRTEGDTSFIGVVHTDGNGMGNRIREFSKLATSNREWVDKMRKMSEKINSANLHALQRMTDFLASKLNLDEKGNVILQAENGKGFRLKEGRIFDRNIDDWKDVIFYPFRPIIFGGEDVAFICDGRIALDLTVYYLKALEETKLADNEPLYGRAGVALVKSHYPFRRAYDLAEDLARSAKQRIKTVEEKPENKGKVSAIDWHLAFTGLTGSVKEIRKREYQHDKLCMRPLSICKTKNTGDWQTWENFVSVTGEFQDKWSENRNKAKTLREVVRKGEHQVEQFFKLNKELRLPEIKNCGPEMMLKGWFNTRCGYFDALEMMDFYFSLQKDALTDCSQENQLNEVNTDE